MTGLLLLMVLPCYATANGKGEFPLSKNRNPPGEYKFSYSCKLIIMFTDSS